MGSEPTDIHLFLSNRLETLADALISHIASNSGHPLIPDTLVVQNRGISRWLNLRIAEVSGIQMNTRYLYPRAIIDSLLEGINPDYKSGKISRFSKDVLFWRIYKSLPKWSTHPKARVLKQYLESDAESTSFLRRYQLAMKIAQYMDQLQTYRPDLLTSLVNKNQASDWVSFIWQSLSHNSLETPPPDLYKSFGDQVDKLESKPDFWPESLHVFAISSLPPIYLHLLKKASKWMPVYIYLTQPSPLYWGDQISKKKQLISQDKIRPNQTGHGLLGNFGKQGQDFLNTLIDVEVFASDESELFEQADSGNLLGKLQNDLYQINPPSTPKSLIENSEGIQVHVCHSPRREIEALRDELFSRFEADPDLTPDQVVIMAPNIETYAASIRSVFGTENQILNERIPYSIADYSTRSSSTVAHAYLSLLDLLESRFSANEVMNFISIPSISKSFDFQQEDWNVLRTWIEDTGIRWGLNSDHRKKTSGIAFAEYSWQQGVDRLTSGYCIHPDEESEWKSTNPHPGIEGNALPLLNRFLEIWQFLKKHQGLASQSISVSAWLEIIREMIEFLFGRSDQQLEECQSLLSLLSDILQETIVAETDEPMTLSVIRSFLEERLALDFSAGSFFSGTVTFCSLKPMRNVPAKFIGLLGMSENAFPRRDDKSEFTEFPDGSRIGDRSRREDDRYLFLESLLAARMHLYISYTGIESQTLNEQPASIVVEELLDALDEYYEFRHKASARETLVIKEPLQPFSPSNFLPTKPISYSRADLDAAESLIGEKSSRSGLMAPGISIRTDIPQSIPLEAFLKFFLNPCRYWLSQRLETSFPFQVRSLEDIEPIESNGLLDYHRGDTMLKHPEILTGENEYLLNDFLPVGALRESTLRKLTPDAQSILTQWSAIPAENPSTCQVNLQFKDLLLQGRIRGVSDEAYKKMRFGKLRSADILSAWLEHLVVCQKTKNPDFRTHLIGREESVSFKKPADPGPELMKLHELFIKGQESALPFFLDTAYLFSKATVSPSPGARKSPSEIAYTAFTKIEDYPFPQRGVAYDTDIQLCFPDPDIVLTKDFANTALTVFGEALQHMEGGSV